MEKRRLGYTDMEFTVIGLGTWAIGGGAWMYGWGPQDDKDSISVIREAIDLSINWIDTAAVYGLGHAEEIVGKAVKGLRDKVFIATKCGRKWTQSGEIYGDLSRESIRQEMENSLRRLNMDYVDLYQIHWPDPDDKIEEAWEEMIKLKEEGKTRYIGVSNFSVAQMRRVQKIHPIASLQPKYNLLNSDIENEILPFCKENNIGVIVYSPMASGLLTGKYDRERINALPKEDWRTFRNPDFQEPKLTRNLKIIDIMKKIGEKYDVTPSQLAITWVLRRDEVTSAIVGARKPGQISENIGGASVPKEALQELQTALEDVGNLP